MRAHVQNGADLCVDLYVQDAQVHHLGARPPIQRITMHVEIPSIVRAELRANTFGQVFGPGFLARFLGQVFGPGFWARFAEFTIYLYTVAGVLI